MAKVLLVDDDELLLKLLQQSLQHHGFEVYLSREGREALHAAYQERPDAVILDLMMPGMHGVELCQRLRDITNVPIVVLSALAQESTKVEALDMGADDYVTKPYRIAELVARLRAHLRMRARAGVVEKAMSIVSAGEVYIDVNRRTVTVRGEEVDLTPTEYALLLCLIRNRDRVVHHHKLLSEGWGPEYVDQLEYLRLYVRYLRQKIEENPSRPQIIKTERGIGYYIAA